MVAQNNMKKFEPRYLGSYDGTNQNSFWRPLLSDNLTA